MFRNGLKLLLALAVGVLTLGMLSAYAADNDGLASDFGGFGEGGGVVDAPLQIENLALQSDGKIVAVGMTNNSFAVARYLPSGALDASFGTGGLVVTKISDAQQRAEATSVVAQPDGKLVVAGTVFGPSGGGDFAVLRYTADGNLDSSFDGDGKVVIDFGGGDDRAAAIALDRDNRIVVGGSAKRGTQSDFAVLRLKANGALDTTFDGNGKATVDFGGDAIAVDLLIQPKGEIVLAGRARVAVKDDEVRTYEALARLAPTGAPDATFDADGRIINTTSRGDAVGSSVALDSNGKLVVAGSGAEATFLVSRYNPNGTTDLTLDGDGTLSTPFGSPDTRADAVLSLPDGTILVAGQSGGQLALARYTANGTLDSSFDGDGTLLLEASPRGTEGTVSLLRAPDGRLLAAGGHALARLFADGTLDAGGRQLAAVGLSGRANKTLVQPDGTIISAGTLEYGTFDSDVALTGHTAAGLPDPLFGSGGTSILVRPGSSERATDALLQPDGKIVVVGTTKQTIQGDRDLLIARFNPDGAPDTACDDDGVRIIDLGGLDDVAYAAALQADGKLLLAITISFPEASQAYMLRIEASCGLPDSTFGTSGRVRLPDNINVVDLQALPEGGSQFVGALSDGSVFLARFRADGGPDDSFGPPGAGGKVITPLKNGFAAAAALLPDGKLLVGAAQFTDRRPATLLLRYTTTGELDPGFGTAGKVVADLGPNGLPSAIALRGDGAFAVTGCNDAQASSPVALFSAAGVLDPAFGDGGKADLLIGGSTCGQSAVFSGTQLIVGGYANNGWNDSFALAAFPTGGEPRALGFAPAPATVAEPAGAALLTVRLSQTAAQTVTVDYAATGGSATVGADYTLAAGTLTFAPGQTAQRISVLITNDTDDEPDETVTISLSSPSNAVLGSNVSATLTISDDDPTPPGSPTPIPGPSPSKGVFLPLVQR